MPGGKTHDKITYVTAFLWTVLFWLIGVFSLPARPQRVLGFMAFLGAYLFGGLFLSPDLDMEHTDPHHRWRRLGCGWLWMPYAYLVDHRSSWSHCPIRGCLLRLLTLLGAGVLFLGGAVGVLHYFGFYGDRDYWTAWGEALEGLREALRQRPALLLFALLGLYLSGLVHIFADVVATRWGAMGRGSRRRRPR